MDRVLTKELQEMRFLVQYAQEARGRLRDTMQRARRVQKWIRPRTPTPKPTPPDPWLPRSG